MSLIREESIRAMGGEVTAEAMKGLASISKARISRRYSESFPPRTIP